MSVWSVFKSIHTYILHCLNLCDSVSKTACLLLFFVFKPMLFCIKDCLSCVMFCFVQALTYNTKQKYKINRRQIHVLIHVLLTWTRVQKFKSWHKHRFIPFSLWIYWWVKYTPTACRKLPVCWRPSSKSDSLFYVLTC